MRVLIAEDSPVARIMLERAVSALGHECILATDGSQAWDLFTRHGADVVISDWMMPGMDGDVLCRRVRESSASSYTYFILLTSLEDQDHVLEGMEAGADDYLKKPFELDDLKARLIAARRVTSLHDRLRAQQGEMEDLNRRLFQESRHDPLTGLGNRTALREQLAELNGRAARDQGAYSVVLCDVDRFKAYNDTVGHLAGDEVLRAVAGAFASERRSGDGVYRYGGEEVLVLLPDQSLDCAAVVAERLRATVEALAIPHAACGPGAVVTVSLGVAHLEQSDDGDAEAIVKRADLALYRAKDLGRNRVEIGRPAVSG
jgi:two-component system cell cycle response regulator